MVHAGEYSEPVSYTARSNGNFRFANNAGVDIAMTGLSQVDYGAENGAGKRWV